MQNPEDIHHIQMPITLKDIARHFGVSIATVSRALHNNPRISEARRKTIQDYAREHDFQANQIAESLRYSRVRPIKIIGVIVPEFTHYYFSSILTGIEQQAAHLGYRIMVAASGENYDKEVKICEEFYAAKVCGIIVSQTKHTTRYDHFQRLINKGIPLVFYDRICTGVDASRVVVDDYTGAFTAVSYLLSTGCRRIAYYNSPSNLQISKNRLNGYRDALLRHGIRPDKRYILECDNRNDAERVTPGVMSMANPPDAFFATNDDTAIGIMYSVKRMGYRVPDDISICGFTNGQRAIACDPMLTTIEQRGVEVGREAADILVGLVTGSIPRNSVVKRVVRTRLVVRGSTRNTQQVDNYK